MPIIEYHDHPGMPGNEVHRSFEMGIAGFDYYLAITDELTGVQVRFRYCIDGGFEFKYPKTTRAIAELYRALEEETKENQQ
ncbi:MAG: hypothetical protein ISR98_00375 [Parcubacteria group bacterium]|nr:hypothetical protein [Parcubacteria group bacterium]